MPKRVRSKESRKNRNQRTDVELQPLRRELDGLVKDGKAEQAVEVAWAFINELCGESPEGSASQSSERIKPGVLKHKLGEFEKDGVLEDVEAVEADAERAFVDPLLEDKATPKRSRHGRRTLPDDLPREPEVIPVDEAERDCPACGEERSVIGYETSEVLEFVPAHFKVIEYRREQRGCPTCREGIATAPVADKIYDRAIERQIRIVALDRSNSLFAGSHQGARRAAVMYTIICTCHLAGVDPQTYIADVLVRLSRGWPAAKMEERLPHRWAQQHAA